MDKKEEEGRMDRPVYVCSVGVVDGGRETVQVKRQMCSFNDMTERVLCMTSKEVCYPMDVRE